MPTLFSNRVTIVRGGGDLASGTIHRLVRCGFPVIVLETPRPSAIRRQVAFCEAVYDGKTSIEGVSCLLASSLPQALKIAGDGQAALLVDPDCQVLQKLRPWALIDAILAKKNLGTSRAMADKTIALGPGFTAGEDVDLVIETKRGHNLGRIITEGSAAPNTGIPGMIAGYSRERVIHAPARGIIHPLVSIGDLVEKGQLLAWIIPADASSATRAGEASLSGMPQGRVPRDEVPQDETSWDQMPAGEVPRDEAHGSSCMKDAALSSRGSFPAQGVPVYATLTGLLRGMIRDGYPVAKGFKIADIDPRQEEYKNCFTISDKARCIAGSVLEGLLYLERTKSGT